MQPKYYQYDCYEGVGVDLTQANAVLETKPDVVVLEYPNNNDTPETLFNSYPPDKKPKAELEAVKAKIKAVSDVHPWAESDIHLFNNIEKLWQEGKDTQVYYIDAPPELTSLNVSPPGEHDPRPREKGVDFCWWAHQCVRAHYMSDNMEYILKKSPTKTPVILSCLELLHWEQVLFLLEKPTPEEMIRHFFEKFDDVNTSNIREKVSDCHPVLQKFWDHKVVLN